VTPRSDSELYVSVRNFHSGSSETGTSFVSMSQYVYFFLD
jgi:hypothetical protein